MYYSESHTMLEMPAWLSQYLNGSHLHDEVEHHCGGNTEHWDVLFSKLANLTEKDIHLRTNEIKRLLQDTGVSHVSKSDFRWRLDPLPLMISDSDWQLLEAGIIQRTQLMNQIMLDLYTEQNLVLNGLIQAKHLQSNPLFLRECFSIPAQEQQVFIAAFDIYRDEQGQFKVLADHFQSPAGLGLLLENRIIARRVMSDEFSECNVQRIANFFQSIQANVSDATPTLRDPRVVILTKGSDDSFYSEHAFLSSYLGYTLVRSADLTVRKGKVWLKSLEGLRKVDVIVRWLADPYLDSLEQNDYSIDGIPGLLQAVRNQTVKLLNPVGCGILETPAVKNNFAAIAQHFLTEPLILKEPACFPAEQNLAFIPAGHQLLSYRDAQFCLDGDTQAEQIKTTLAKNAKAYYFKEKSRFSTAPFWDDQALTAQPIVFRCFAMTTQNGIKVLPSALCSNSKLTQATLSSGWIKDTWIRSHETQSQPLPLPKTMRKMSDLALLEGVIPSRTAENLFWLGRNLERGENTVRMLRLLIDRFTEFAIYPDKNNQQIVTRLVEGVVNQALVFPYKKIAKTDSENRSYIPREIAVQLFSDKNVSGSLLNILKAVSHAALQVRELLSSDSWRIIDDIGDEVRRIERTNALVSTRVMQATLDRVIGSLMAFNGSTSDSMANSNGWFMVDIGRRVERSIQLVSVVEELLADELSEIEQVSMLEAVLSCQVSLVTHKRRYRMFQSIETGIELLLLDAEYPRSLLYQLEQLSSLCKLLPEKRKPGLMAAHEKVLLKSKTICHLAERDLLASAEQKKRLLLAKEMHSIKDNLETFCDLLLVQYFSHTKPAVPLNRILGA